MQRRERLIKGIYSPPERIAPLDKVSTVHLLRNPTMDAFDVRKTERLANLNHPSAPVLSKHRLSGLRTVTLRLSCQLIEYTEQQASTLRWPSAGPCATLRRWGGATWLAKHTCGQRGRQTAGSHQPPGRLLQKPRPTGTRRTTVDAALRSLQAQRRIGGACSRSSHGLLYPRDRSGGT